MSEPLDPDAVIAELYAVREIAEEALEIAKRYAPLDYSFTLRRLQRSLVEPLRSRP